MRINIKCKLYYFCAINNIITYQRNYYHKTRLNSFMVKVWSKDHFAEYITQFYPFARIALMAL